MIIMYVNLNKTSKCKSYEKNLMQKTFSDKIDQLHFKIIFKWQVWFFEEILVEIDIREREMSKSLYLQFYSIGETCLNIFW
jgi:hypothetical protein